MPARPTHRQPTTEGEERKIGREGKKESKKEGRKERKRGGDRT
jgi:hypothetical protein